MLNSLKRLNGASIQATDSFIGEVKDAYFDDERWVVRYLVVETGTWLNERQVLISPYAITQPLMAGGPIKVNLTRGQVKNSPDIDTHKPVSRRHEQEYASYYTYPDYWGSAGLWAMGGYPLLAPLTPADLNDERMWRAPEKVDPADVHLRSVENVAGYDIEASDGSIGHVHDFIFDDESWALRYLLVDTHNWWPGGKHVLIAVHWIDAIDWSLRKVTVQLTREQVRNSPVYDEAKVIDREYEQRLHNLYGRPGYWD